IILPNYQIFTEDIYSDSIYPNCTFLLTALFNRFPFSITEIILALFALSIPVGLGFAIFRKLRWRNYFLLLFSAASVLYACFYFFWGFNYYRQPLLERINIAKSSIDSTSFRNALESILEDANASYLEIDAMNKQEIDGAIERGFERVADRLRLEFPAGKRKPKSLIFNAILDKTLTNGFFSPLFHEIHVNSKLLPVEFPFTLAHEKCHQIGIASEADANFLAYLVCISSDNPVVQYSAKMDVLGEFLLKARRTLSDYSEVRAKVAPGIIEDFHKINNRWRQHAGAVSRVSRRTYDSYLKANRISEGIDNYAGVVEMVVLWQANEEKY
ncbi:MAG: DUF3810 domain-containing protein, partial [bacterium]